MNNDTFDGESERDNSDLFIEEEDVSSIIEKNQHDQVTGAAQDPLPILIIDDQIFEGDNFVEDSISGFIVL